ncbi:hypothetical protein [Acidiphilium multivorum]|uniref:hypothetical protein n=1 Tax=Acidiphilium multivorum TaxID=62140 RepID=UPI001F4C2179|nr:hypothetical protein [Acidiphilium multivorum]
MFATGEDDSPWRCRRSHFYDCPLEQDPWGRRRAGAVADLRDGGSSTARRRPWHDRPCTSGGFQKDVDHAMRGERREVGDMSCEDGLTLILPTRGERDISAWIEYHVDLLAGEYGDDFSIIVASEIEPGYLRALENRFVRHFRLEECFFRRIERALDMTTTRNFVLVADDDFLLSLDRREIEDMPDDVISISPKTLRSTGTTVNELIENIHTVAISSHFEFCHDTKEERLVRYLSAPLPSDNSIFYGIFNKDKYRTVLRKHMPFMACLFPACDWTFVAALMAEYKFRSSETSVLLRDTTNVLDLIARELRDIKTMPFQAFMPWAKAIPLHLSLSYIRDVIAPDLLPLLSKEIVRLNMERYDGLVYANLLDPEVGLNRDDIADVVNNSKWLNSEGCVMFQNLFNQTMTL